MVAPIDDKCFPSDVPCNPCRNHRLLNSNDSRLLNSHCFAPRTDRSDQSFFRSSSSSPAVVRGCAGDLHSTDPTQETWARPRRLYRLYRSVPATRARSYDIGVLVHYFNTLAPSLLRSRCGDTLRFRYICVHRNIKRGISTYVTLYPE